MTLWNLLVSVCFFSAVAGALQTTKLAGLGLGGYTLAIVTGLIIGSCCAWAMWNAGRIVENRASKLASESTQRWCFRALYLTAILWCCLSTILGIWTTPLLIRVIFRVL